MLLPGEIPPSTHKLSPPRFAKPEPLPDSVQEVTRLSRGTILLLRIESDVTLAAAAQKIWVTGLAFPNAAMAIWAPPEIAAKKPAILLAAPRLGVRAVVTDDQPLPQQLRNQLTSSEYLGAAFGVWLRRTVEAPDELNGLWEHLFAAPDQFKDVASIAKAARMTPHHLRKILRPTVLEKPTTLRRTAIAITHALKLQRESRTTVARHALELGYADQPAMCRSFRQLFDLSPTEVQRRMGFECLIPAGISASRRTT